MAGRNRCVAVGLAAIFGACAHPGRAPRSDFAGVTLERAAELPETAAASSAGGTAAFARVCAMLLRDPRDGREMLLVRSHVTAPITREGATTVTRLESATGDYALLTADRRRREPPPYLRVDCTSGRAVGWVEAGA